MKMRCFTCSTLQSKVSPGGQGVCEGHSLLSFDALIDENIIKEIKKRSFVDMPIICKENSRFQECWTK